MEEKKGEVGYGSSREKGNKNVERNEMKGRIGYRCDEEGDGMEKRKEERKAKLNRSKAEGKAA